MVPRLSRLFRLVEMGRRDLSSIDWASVDWTRPSGELAVELGVSLPTLGKYRALAGASRSSTRGRRDLSSIDWTSVDWTRQPTTLARELGVSLSTLLRHRDAAEAGPAEEPPAGLSRGQGRARTDVDWGSAGLGERPDGAIAADLGVSTSLVRTQRVRRHIPSAPVRTGVAPGTTASTWRGPAAAAPAPVTPSAAGGGRDERRPDETWAQYFRRRGG